MTTTTESLTPAQLHYFAQFVDEYTARTPKSAAARPRVATLHASICGIVHKSTLWHSAAFSDILSSAPYIQPRKRASRAVRNIHSVDLPRTASNQICCF